MKKKPLIRIVGGGLAGCEAAWQALNLGCQVVLYEMRPNKMTPAHKGGGLGELVCSNSLKSMNLGSAQGLLKYELSSLNSLILKSAYEASVPAGEALAVDRDRFSAMIECKLREFESFTLVNEEITKLPIESELERDSEIWIVASGPLTSDGLYEELKKLCINVKEDLHFYDALAPILNGETIDMDKVFWANRWDKDGSSKGDYLNIPLNKNQYYEFIDEIAKAEKIEPHDFEDPVYFESCLPIEVMVERGIETLRFGPMKAAGIFCASEKPYANIQLRIENADRTMFSMVGFQTKMKWFEQKRVFRTLPGLENVDFLRFGSIHRNTYLSSPFVLNRDLSFKLNNRILLAGQISGVEGYMESTAMGLVAGRVACGKLDHGHVFSPPPCGTIIGSLVNYICEGSVSKFTPINANLGLLEPAGKRRGENKLDRKMRQCNHCRGIFDKYLSL